MLLERSENASVNRFALFGLFLTILGLSALAFTGLAQAETLSESNGEWKTLAPSSQNRQEVAYVEVDGKFYLAGGGTLHERYDPKANSWTTVKPLPANLDHIQGVELGGKIYYIGGLSSFPGPHADTMYIYDPATDTFIQGTPMPEGRGRGAGGVAVYNGKIYYAGGLHDGKAVSWFDVYDPATDSWKQLPNMPRVRDHFQAAIVDGKFYAIGGRDTAINATTTKVDLYDLSSGAGGTWQTPNTALPTARGGFAAAVLGKEILIIGGEGGGKTYNEVEAYSTTNNSWRNLAPMPTARHGIQAAVCNGGVYVAAGGKVQGGGSKTNVHEAFFLNGVTTCESSSQPPPPDEDTTVPTVVGTTPPPDATEVAADTNLTATFSEEMDTSTINTDTFTLTKQGSTTSVSAAVTYDTAAKKATLNPGADLEAEATYTTTVKGGSEGAKDPAGNALANNKTWSFTTAASATEPPPDTTAPSVTPESMTFGEVEVGKSATREVTLKNPGSEDEGPIVINSVEISGAPAFSRDFQGPMTLKPGESKAVKVRFAPRETGLKKGELVFEHDGSGEALKVPLSGTGTAKPGGCTLIGTSGDDTLRGTRGDDVICGLRGDDTIYGFNGNDILRGGPGTNKLVGGNGNDTLIGGNGKDTAYGQNGNDKVIGRGGNDTLKGGSGTNRIVGGDNNDRHVGGDGVDRIFGQNGNDTLIGLNGNDYLRGDRGRDRLYGNSGRDRLNGKDKIRGNDYLNGGRGRDRGGADPRDRVVSIP